MNHFVEIRSYTLKPGTRDKFHRLFLEEAYPLLKRWNVDVVAYGPSLHDENSYYLMPVLTVSHTTNKAKTPSMVASSGVRAHGRRSWP